MRKAVGKLQLSLRMLHLQTNAALYYDLDLSSSVSARVRAVSANFTSFWAAVSESGESPSCDRGRFGVYDRARDSKSNLVCFALYCFDFVSCLPLAVKDASFLFLLGLIDVACGVERTSFTDWFDRVWLQTGSRSWTRQSKRSLCESTPPHTHTHTHSSSSSSLSSSHAAATFDRGSLRRNHRDPGIGLSCH